MRTPTWKQLDAATGGLTKTSKMPCASYSIPARITCPVGDKLALIPGSVCEVCYADKRNMYRLPTTQRAQLRRLQATKRPGWKRAMTLAIAKTKKAFFRVHDSGDFYSAAYFLDWCDVARDLLGVQFWAPTRERELLRTYGNAVPSNMVVRLSAPMVDGAPPRVVWPTSTVHKAKPPIGYACPASKQGGVCGDCRACWDPEVTNVSYPAH
jgi:hypothetical protein